MERAKEASRLISSFKKKKQPKKRVTDIIVYSDDDDYIGLKGGVVAMITINNLMRNMIILRDEVIRLEKENTILKQKTDNK